ncbi:MAG: GIY-YIG nuclease family protein [Candidatus Eisenbacteria bacterium]|uniref:GIY-YIG nuclease family protein n=1 Tax=Eiseniibacteriota bacterium TaxID=2212470 RepID=A0A7Y2H478_UNCEI|nr:GIY-YIG nuclease family protein [Candidatus Eisenbacteria bacterium]
MWHLYVLRTSEDRLYTGIAKDVTRRLAEHEGGLGKGAKALRSRGPFTLEYTVPLGDRSLALKAEYALKQLSRSAKESLVEQSPDREGLLERLGLVGLD